MPRLEQAEALERSSRLQAEFSHVFERARVRLWVAEQNRAALEAWAQENASLAGQDLRLPV